MYEFTCYCKRKQCVGDITNQTNLTVDDCIKDTVLRTCSLSASEQWALLDTSTDSANFFNQKA